MHLEIFGIVVCQWDSSFWFNILSWALQKQENSGFLPKHCVKIDVDLDWERVKPARAQFFQIGTGRLEFPVIVDKSLDICNAVVDNLNMNSALLHIENIAGNEYLEQKYAHTECFLVFTTSKWLNGFTCDTAKYSW